MNADFVVVAARVGSASGLAISVDAQFAGQAVAVSVADFVTVATGAALALRAVGVLFALKLALAGYAAVMARTVEGRFTRTGHPHAALLGGRVALEASGALAPRRVVVSTAEGVGPAHVVHFARI